MAAMTSSLPIAKYAAPLVEWLRTSTATFTWGKVSALRPRIQLVGGDLVIEATLTVKAQRTPETEALFQFMEGSVPIKLDGLPDAVLRVPNPMGFQVEATDEGGARLVWSQREKPWVDTINPFRRFEPVVQSIEVRESGLRIEVTRGPDQEVEFTD